jgi:hypothetical protein
LSVGVNRGTLDEMREGRTAHERPQVVVTAEYRHGTLVEVVISNIGRGDAKNVTFEFSAPMESSVSYRRDSEVVPLSELPHSRDGLNYLAPGAEIAIVWDNLANLVPLLREMGLQEGIRVTSRYESLTGEPYGTPWTINPLLIPGASTPPADVRNGLNDPPPWPSDLDQRPPPRCSLALAPLIKLRCMRWAPPGGTILTMRREMTVRHSEPDDYEAVYRIYSGPHAMADTLGLPFSPKGPWRERPEEDRKGEVSLVACAGFEVVGHLSLYL